VNQTIVDHDTNVAYDILFLSITTHLLITTYLSITTQMSITTSLVLRTESRCPADGTVVCADGKPQFR
jgi:DNA-binding transcriptional regulator YbjK